jgi:hypothetical protein
MGGKAGKEDEIQQQKIPSAASSQLGSQAPPR